MWLARHMGQKDKYKPSFFTGDFEMKLTVLYTSKADIFYDVQLGVGQCKNFQSRRRMGICLLFNPIYLQVQAECLFSNHLWMLQI